MSYNYDMLSMSMICWCIFAPKCKWQGKNTYTCKYPNVDSVLKACGTTTTMSLVKIDLFIQQKYEGKNRKDT